jgi:lipopolysaccharide biosynthesis glycosyltransferase
MLNSLCSNNSDENFDVFCLHSSLSEDDKNYINNHIKFDNIKINFIQIDNHYFENAPTVKRYPIEVYYRLVAYEFLPKNIDRVLYLDVDIIINKSLKELYNLDFKENLFFASTNTGKFLTWFNRIRLGIKKNHIYPNTGVLLINIQKMREVAKKEDIFEFIEIHKPFMTLYDEDVVFGLYGDKISLLDDKKYNLSDRNIKRYNTFHKNKIDKKWVDENNVIIHYLGKNKPWKNNYKGILKSYYDKYDFNDK